MTKFLRARNPECKSARHTEVKNVTDEIFMNGSYHDITLTVMADKLGWSRTNLYHYMDTKEDVLLDIASDRMNNYYDALMTAMPADRSHTADDVARMWADVIDDNWTYMLYRSILPTIVETNVSPEKLASYRVGHHERSTLFSIRLAGILGITPEQAYGVMRSVTYHCMGAIGEHHPEADVDRVYGIEHSPVDFKDDAYRFITMCLVHATGQ